MEFSQFSSLGQFEKAFPDEAACVAYFAGIRWGGKVVCPYCGGDKVYTLKGKVKRYKCGNVKGSCARLFSVRVRTIFEDSNLPLKKWFLAFYFATNAKGCSSVTLGKFIGVPQKTAWHLLSKIRVMLASVAPQMMSGEVEVDEVWHGPKEGNKHQNKRLRGGPQAGKIPVLGMRQRGGDIVIKALTTVDRKTVMPIMRKHIAIGTSVYTDEAHVYKVLNDNGYAHDTVSHGKAEYVKVSEDATVVHTNSIESAWGIYRRTIMGTYHYVSPKHLQKYCTEIAYRINRRGDSIQQRFDEALNRSTTGTVTYKQITQPQA